MDCVKEGKSRAIKMGYLVKSPSRNREKASYALFWKVRWCVLVQVFYTDPDGTTEYSTFLLYYYEDEESYRQRAAPKGKYICRDTFPAKLIQAHPVLPKTLVFEILYISCPLFD